jgi:hypothetical protein
MARDRTQSEDRDRLPGDSVRTVGSFLLFVHLFIIVVCLSSHWAPSVLQRRLLDTFRPYAQLLNFDLDGTRFYLTHAALADVDHRIEVLPDGRNDAVDDHWHNLARGFRGSERYHRYQRLADTMAYFEEQEETTALIAQAVARCYLRQEQTRIRQLRCRRHLLQSWTVFDEADPARQDPWDPSYLTTVYRADVIHSEHRIDILKRADSSLEAAPDRERSSADSPRNP